MSTFVDRNGNEIRVGDMLEWESVQAGTVRGPVVVRSPWMDKDALWVRLPDGREAPLLTRDTPHMVRV